MILCPHQQQLHHASLPLALLILHSTIHTRVFFSAYWHLFLFHSIVTIYYILLFVVEGILWLVCGMSCHDVCCQVYIYLLTSTVLEVPHNNMFMDHPFLLFCHLLSSPLLSSPLSVLLFAWHYQHVSFLGPCFTVTSSNLSTPWCHAKRVLLSQ